MKKITEFLNDERGLAIVEYALITVGASLGITAAITAFAYRYNYKVETFLNEILPFLDM